jgi:hypothetical protein
VIDWVWKQGVSLLTGADIQADMFQTQVGGWVAGRQAEWLERGECLAGWLGQLAGCVSGWATVGSEVRARR